MKKLPQVGEWYRRKDSGWNYLVMINHVSPALEGDSEKLGYLDWSGMGWAEDGCGSATSFLNLFSRVTKPPANKKASMEEFEKRQRGEL